MNMPTTNRKSAIPPRSRPCGNHLIVRPILSSPSPRPLPQVGEGFIELERFFELIEGQLRTPLPLVGEGRVRVSTSHVLNSPHNCLKYSLFPSRPAMLESLTFRLRARTMAQLDGKSKILGPFALAMLAVIAVIDLRSLPLMASYGLSAIFIYSLAGLLFLIPGGLVCAELSTHLQHPGGMYLWIREAFGDGAGFLAIWLEWLNNVIGFPASVSFIAVTLTYLYDPNLVQHKFIILGLTLTILWTTTFICTRGIETTSRLNILGALLGTTIPAFIFIIMGVGWLMGGKPLQFDLSWGKLIPNLQTLNPGFFAAIILGFGGMQIISFHTDDVKNPRRDYPRAIWAAISLIFSMTLFTTLAIAAVVPQQQLTLVSGLVSGIERFFNAFEMPWAASAFVLLLIFSLFTTLNAWFLGPAKGLVIAAHNGFLPRYFSFLNRKQVPANILVLQALIASLVSTLLVFMPDINAGFWILLNLSSQSALMVYILIFSSAIKHRYLRNHQQAESAYQIPGGKRGIWLVGGIGIVTCAIALLTSIIPPTIIKTGDLRYYETILIGSNLIFLSIPLAIIYYYSKRREKAPQPIFSTNKLEGFKALQPE